MQWDWEPFQLFGKTITSEIFGAIPHHVMVKYSVIPYQVDADSVHFLCGDHEADLKVADELQFILDKRVTLTVIPTSMLEEAIDRLGLVDDAEIECASEKFRFRCMKRWRLLKRTEKADQRFCQTCERIVYWADNWVTAKQLGREGKCIAITDETTGTLLGELE